MSNRTALLIQLAASWALMLVILLTVATISATRKSQIRTECYKTAKHIEACPKPAAWERWLAKVIG